MNPVFSDLAPMWEAWLSYDILFDKLELLIWYLDLTLFEECDRILK